MSALTTAPPQSGATSAQGLPGIPPRPQVNLLPPEIRAGRAAGHVRAWLGVGVLVAVLVAGLVVVWASLTVRQADQELQDAQDQTQALLAEQAQYAEVPQVMGDLTAAHNARGAAMATEVLWRPYLRAIAATAPAGVSVDNVTATVASPTDPSGAAATADPLLAVGVGQVTWESRSLTLPDTKAWLAALETIPGFATPWFSSVTVAEEEGTTYYQVSGTVQITEDAYALRFPEDLLQAGAHVEVGN